MIPPSRWFFVIKSFFIRGVEIYLSCIIFKALIKRLVRRTDYKRTNVKEVSVGGRQMKGSQYNVLQSGDNVWSLTYAIIFCILCVVYRAVKTRANVLYCFSGKSVD